MKLLFLYVKTHDPLIPSRWERYVFRPHLYGPYSRQVDMDSDELEELGFLSVRRDQVKPMDMGERGEILHTYRLTSEGEKAAARLVTELSPLALSIIKSFHVYNEMTLRSFIGVVYRKFPEYVTHSRIKSWVLGEGN
jgi:uncharacterized protein YwgA